MVCTNTASSRNVTLRAGGEIKKNCDVECGTLITSNFKRLRTKYGKGKIHKRSEKNTVLKKSKKDQNWC